MKLIGKVNEGEVLPRWGLRWRIVRESDYVRLVYTENGWISVGLYLALGRFIGKIQFAIEL